MTRPLTARGSAASACTRLGVGVVAARFAVVSQLAPGDAVEVAQLDIDKGSSW